MFLLSYKSLPFNLNGFFNCYQTLLWSWYRALNQNQVIVNINLDNLQILNGNLLAAHVAWHSLALEYAAWCCSGTVGTLMAMELGTMCHRSSVLSISLDGALEAFTLGNSGCVNLIACREDVSLNLIFYGILFSILKLEFSYICLLYTSPSPRD